MKNIKIRIFPSEKRLDIGRPWRDVGEIVLSQKIIILLILSMLIPATPLFSQTKKELDAAAFNNWNSLKSAPGICNDGSYVYYQTGINDFTPSVLHIQAINNRWAIEVPGGRNVLFTSDSKHAVFFKGRDSLCVLDFETKKLREIPRIEKFKLFLSGNIERLSYLSSDQTGMLTIEDLNTTHKQSFLSVKSYTISPDGGILVLNCTTPYSKGVVKWVSLTDNREKQIWRGTNADNFLFSKTGETLVFKDAGVRQAYKSIWLYSASDVGSKELILRQDNKIDTSLLLVNIVRFSADSRKIFAIIRKYRKIALDPTNVSVDVWSYRDAKIQTEQLAERTPYTDYLVCIDLDASKRSNNLHLLGEVPKTNLLNQRDAVVTDNANGDPEEASWSSAAQYSYAIFDPVTRLSINVEGMKNIKLSPRGDFIIGYTTTGYELYSLETATGKKHNISKTVNVPSYFDDYNFFKTKGLQFAAWLPDTDLFLAYDKFDIWLIDPTGEQEPVNLTNYYGREHQIVFRLADCEVTNSQTLISNKQNVLLHILDLSDKNEGFCMANLQSFHYWGKLIKPQAYCYDQGPIKAKDANIYLVVRSNTVQAPNVFWTSDFRAFTQVSRICPEDDYEWLTSELVKFNTGKRGITSGLIYKPENFDPQKKYPVIIQYYEKKSDDLDKFIGMESAGTDGFALPWFVSHGYIVFQPDIQYHAGKTGISVLDAVNGAVNYLSGFKWVDSKHIGLAGHSFGGFETNFIITHSNRFAAAFSASGVSDLVSDYLGVNSGGHTGINYFETGQGRMRSTLWDRPDLYLSNSPILYANRINTPLLLLADKEDASVHFEQGLGLFLALRHLGKKCWMLQYDGNGHTVTGKAKIDLTLRAEQFFDFYLKGSAAPKWMVEGISADYKQADNGLELEPRSKVPGDGILLPEFKNKLSNLKRQRFRINY